MHMYKHIYIYIDIYIYIYRYIYIYIYIYIYCSLKRFVFGPQVNPEPKTGLFPEGHMAAGLLGFRV